MSATESGSILHNGHVHENGHPNHTYCGSEYCQSNDGQQNNPELILHLMCLKTLDDRLFIAPVKTPKHVLDIGSGTGAWATALANQFPSAEIIGTDLTPVNNASSLPNLRFKVDDCTTDWTFPKNHFDFIHIRGLSGSIADWPALYQQMFRHMQPGGYIEQVELSIHNRSIRGQLPPNHALARLSRYGVHAGIVSGRTFEIAENMAGLVREAGFKDVVEKRFRWPIGAWSSDFKYKDIGRWNLLDWEQGIAARNLDLYARVLRWMHGQAQEFLEDVREALLDDQLHAYHEVRLVYARKPL